MAHDDPTTLPPPRERNALTVGLVAVAAAAIAGILYAVLAGGTDNETTAKPPTSAGASASPSESETTEEATPSEEATSEEATPSADATATETTSAEPSSTAAPSTAEGTPLAQNTYTYWTFPSTAKGFATLDADIEITSVTKDAPYFWAQQFELLEGAVGYMGLQSYGVRRADQSRGKMVIFSIWDASDAKGPACGTFGGEGTGFSCSVAYQWVPGRSYRVRVTRDSSSATGTWWRSEVLDRDTGKVTQIGRILVPQKWLGLGSSTISFTEYFGGALTTCESQPKANGLFRPPLAEKGTVRTMTKSNTLQEGPGHCENGRATDVKGGASRHQMGL